MSEDSFVVEFDARPDGLDAGPRLVGPFDTREDAREWVDALTSRHPGSWSWFLTTVRAASRD